MNDDLGEFVGKGFALPSLVGIDFSVGISFAITLGVADTNTTALTVVGDVTGLMLISKPLAFCASSRNVCV